MAEYAFVTTWRVAAPIEQVWEAIAHSERWPHWWKGVESVVELEPGGPDGVGNLRRYTWKSALPYRLSFDMRTTRVVAPYEIEGVASGELAGHGHWRLAGDGGITTVRYDWNVRTTKAWMNLIAPLARPLFAWNHDVVMGWGGAGLARLLGTTLVNETAAR